MTTQAQKITALEAANQQQAQQIAALTQAVTAFLEGNLDGPGSAKGYLLAVDPTLEVTPAAFEFG